jgi:hypothetical protein
MTELDECVKRHDELCSCSTMHIEDLKYCDCGQADRAAELTKLRAALDEARRIIKSLPYIYPPAAAWLEKYPIVPD